jgi:hypothetical protein
MVNNKTLVNSVVSFKGNLGEKWEIKLTSYKNKIINKKVKMTQCFSSFIHDTTIAFRARDSIVG